MFCKSGKLPEDIPASPASGYGDKGWNGWGDWLGTGNIANQLREYRSFKEARKFARSLKLTNTTEWREFCKSGKLPEDIPASPASGYGDKGWNGWGDWLGTGNIAPSQREFRRFKQARKYAKSLGLIGENGWRRFCRSGDRPADIPSNPDAYYKDKGWIGWGDWFGTGTIAVTKKEFRTFQRARKFARSLNLKGQTQWREFCKAGKRPEDIPSSPHKTYKDKGWAGMPDWLGTDNIAPGQTKWRPFKEARKFARSLNLKGQTQWREFCKAGKRPEDIPSSPDKTYNDKGWVSWGDWLGK